MADDNHADETVPALLDIDDVKRIYGIGKTSVYAGLANGTFPQPVKIGRLNRWRPQDITAHIDAGAKAKGPAVV